MIWGKDEVQNIAKLTSYGCYLDCEFTTAKYPNEENHIVGDLAEYVYDLEQQLAEKDKEIKQLHLDLDYQKKITVEKDIQGDKYIDFLNKEISKWKERVIEEEDFKLAYKFDLGQIRKQICDEIREKLEDDFEYDCEYTYGKLIEMINKVEKGEQQ